MSGWASPPPPSDGEVGVHLGHVGAAEVVDDDVVGAAEGVEVDALDVVEVHRHVGDVAEEPDAPAVGGDVDVLGDVGAVEQHRVEAGLALERVVVVARVPDERVVAGAHEGGVVAVAAVEQVVALAAEEQVLAEAAVHRELDAVGFQRRGVHDVVAAQRVEGQPVVGLLLEEDVDRGLEAEDVDPAGVAGGTEHVVAVGAVDGDRVGRAVAAAVRPAQVEAGLRHVGAAEVADDDVVGAAERAEVDALDVVEVHRHVGDVAEEQDAPAVGDDVDVLGDVGAEEQHRVGAVLALERVVAVARVPLEHVVAGAHEGQVVAVVAEDEVVAVAAEEHVGALRAEERVVAGAAVDGQLDHAGRQRGRASRRRRRRAR